MQNDRTVSEPKNDSKTSDQGFFNKYLVSPIASLTVRSRRASDQGTTRPKMFTANSRLKKRRLSTRNLKATAKVFKPVDSKEVDSKEVDSKEVDSKEIDCKESAPDSDSTMADGTVEPLEAKFARHLSNESETKAYADERQRLVDAETKEAWDTPKQVSEQEIWASKLVTAIREYERNVIFGNKASEDIPGPETLDMGGQFLTNKQRIEQNSLLFGISHHVPKGALLHLHFNAELNPERLLEEARKMSNMYVWSIMPLTSLDALATTELAFRIMPETTKSCDIFCDDYQGKAKNFNDATLNDVVWMRWAHFRKRFEEIKEFSVRYSQPPMTPGLEPGPRTCSDSVAVKLDPAEYWIKQKMVLSEREAYNPAQTVNGVWARFNQATRCFKGLLNYRAVYEWYIGQAIDRLIDEKIMYAELRPMLMDKSIPTDDGKDQFTIAQQLRLIAQCVRDKQDQLRRKHGNTDKFPFSPRIIYCTPRSIPIEKMRSEMRHCLELKQEFPDLICGFDLVGAEDRPNHIGFYAKELKAFQETCLESGQEIPFLFHAGETLLDTGGSSNPKNSNLYDAVALKSKRIGHGFALMKHPELVERFRRTDNQLGICIELCPISNELLHLCRNIKEHPYPELLAAGIPCCVNSDNPSLFSNSMCHEFYQIMVGCPTMSIFSWKQLALWSLEYSCLKDEEKEECKRIFLESWRNFCDRVIDYCDVLVKDRGGKLMIDKDGNFTINEEAAEAMYADLPELDKPKEKAPPTLS